jgi:hypothetical protein
MALFHMLLSNICILKYFVMLFKSNFNPPLSEILMLHRYVGVWSPVKTHPNLSRLETVFDYSVHDDLASVDCMISFYINVFHI